MAGIFPTGGGEFTGLEVTGTALSADLAEIDNTTTPVLVLSGPQLETETSYVIEFLLQYRAGSVTDGRVSLEGPSGCSGLWALTADHPNALVALDLTDRLSFHILNGAGATTDSIHMGRGFIRTGSTAGTLGLYVTQNVSGSTGITVRAGTHIICRKMQ